VNNALRVRMRQGPSDHADNPYSVAATQLFLPTGEISPINVLHLHKWPAVGKSACIENSYDTCVCAPKEQTRFSHKSLSPIFRVVENARIENLYRER
jgi:hypothetical protein